MIERCFCGPFPKCIQIVSRCVGDFMYGIDHQGYEVPNGVEQKL